ncbi:MULTISPECIES: Uma2 family endonuclease [Leptolyngbya]|uniref:Uma2 family endonuclease n=1 Tax=Leptolyngbya TaxID=47251 RepID=UPI0016878762|nr:Uma2 family endonuclease [Leptolyngbya sp. FACHB-1624]MBD1857756.1 Uma2 family endonuclease [Leptolyngbya sp. FACHB-1624]
MTQAKPRFRTIEEYLDYDDGTDTRYELVNGELVEMPPEMPINNTIAVFLIVTFVRLGIPHYRLATGHQIVVSSSRVTARQPDLVVHTEESVSAILSGSRVLQAEMPPPLLVVEVVSNSEEDQRSRDRDYIEKRKEYALRGIAEYWIIDPNRNTVTVLALNGNEYQEIGCFQEGDRVVSPTFSELDLTAKQVLNAGM